MDEEGIEAVQAGAGGELEPRLQEAAAGGEDRQADDGHALIPGPSEGGDGHLRDVEVHVEHPSRVGIDALGPEDAKLQPPARGHRAVGQRFGQDRGHDTEGCLYVGQSALLSTCPVSSRW